MKEKTMTINELMDRINEAQALAYQQHIQANAIVINENFVKVPEKMVGNAVCPPMICGLEMHFTKAELPDNTMFAVCEVRETARQKAIRLAKQEAIRDFAEKVKTKLREFADENEDNDGKIDKGIFLIDVIGVITNYGEIISLGLIDDLLKEYEND